jgi:hypothetical protein
MDHHHLTSMKPVQLSEEGIDSQNRCVSKERETLVDAAIHRESQTTRKDIIISSDSMDTTEEQRQPSLDDDYSHPTTISADILSSGPPLHDDSMHSLNRHESIVLPRNYYPLRIGTLSSLSTSYIYEPDIAIMKKLKTHDDLLPIIPLKESHPKQLVFDDANEEQEQEQQQPFKVIDIQDQIVDINTLLLCLYDCISKMKGSPYRVYRDLATFETALNTLQGQVMYEMADDMLFCDLETRPSTLQPG